MKKIAGISLFIGALGWIIFFAYSLHDTGYSDAVSDAEVVAIGVFFSISSASAIYYVWVTLFRKVNNIESIEIETKIIKLQIEKKELLARLEAIEKNG